jgi:hypothetical protein
MWVHLLSKTWIKSKLRRCLSRNYKSLKKGSWRKRMKKKLGNQGYKERRLYGASLRMRIFKISWR